MSAEIDNAPNIANIHRIRSIKNNRPTTALNNKVRSNKQFANILKNGTLDIEKMKLLDHSKKLNKIEEYSNTFKNSTLHFIPGENEMSYNEKEFSKDFNMMEKSELEKYLNDENFKLDFVNKQKEKLKNIDLLEKNYGELYGWKSLLSKNRPLSCYTHTKKLNQNFKDSKGNFFEEKKNIEYDMNNIYSQEYKEKENAEFYLKDSAEINSCLLKKKKYKHPFRDETIRENEKNNFSSIEKSDKKKEKLDFVFPVALIDENEDKLYEFITIPKNISERRKKMEYFLHIQSKSQKNFAKKKKNAKSNKKGNTLRNSVSLNTTQVNNPLYKDETVQASGFINICNNNKNKNLSKTFSKAFNNNSRVSQSVVSRIKKQSNPAKNIAPRPMSVYAKRSDSAVYYMSKEFSDYFKQDLKEFSEKFSLLHPKIKCDNTKIKKLLEEIKSIQDQDEKLLKNFKIDDDVFDIKDLNLAGNSKNIYPLLKSFLKNYYSEDEVNKFFKDKNYPISNRPLGNRIGNINNKTNIRSKNLEDLKSSTNSLRNSANENKLNINTYDKDDPDLKIFSENLENCQSRNSILEPHPNQASFTKENNKMSIDEIQKGMSNEPEHSIKDREFGTQVINSEKVIEQFENNFSNENISEKKISIGEEAAFDIIIPKSEIFREKKIASRPKTAINKKFSVNANLPSLIVERIAETEENSEISFDRRMSNAKNIKIDLPIKDLEKLKNSPLKNLTFKGTSNNHYSYKVLNSNLKNQNNQQGEGSNILKDAIHVKNVHNRIMGGNINNTNSNSNKNSNMIEAFYEIKQKKRPTTSRWSSNLSNMSNRLSNQFNTTFIKNDFEKGNNKLGKKNTTHINLLNNQNKHAATNNVTYKEESSYYITATKNEKFLNDNFGPNEKKNVIEKSKIRCQSAATRKILSNTQSYFGPNYNPIISSNNVNRDLININNLNLQINSKKFV